MQPDIVIGGEFGAQNEARAEEEAQSIAAEPSRNLSQLGRRGVKFVRTASCELFLRGVAG